VHPDEVTIAVLLPMPQETAGAEFMFADEFDKRDEGLGFILCQIESLTGGAPRGVVLASPSQIGNIHAAMAVVQLKQKYKNVHTVICCGIAGGIPHPDPDPEDLKDPERDIHLGDIVVLNQVGVLQYDYGADKRRPEFPANAAPQPQEYYLDPREGPFKPGARCLTTCNSLTVYEKKGTEGPWITRLRERLPLGGKAFERPSEGDKGCAYDSLQNGAVVTTFRRSGRIIPKVFHGAIGSANCVLKNPFRRDELRRGQNKLLAVEMEAAGVAAACHVLGLEFTTVRGICDYCDRNKNDQWQQYAAAIAAAYTYCLIQRLPAQTPVTKQEGDRIVADTQDFDRAAIAAGAPNSGATGHVPVAPSRRTPQPTQAARLDSSAAEIAATATAQKYLAAVDAGFARHDLNAVTAKSLEIEASLFELEKHLDRTLLAQVLKQIARAHLTLSQEAASPEEKKKQRDMALDFVRRARELAK